MTEKTRVVFQAANGRTHFHDFESFEAVQRFIEEFRLRSGVELRLVRHEKLKDGLEFTVYAERASVK